MTFGHGLSDCHIPPDMPGKYPSKYAWPNIVADNYNLELDNMSHCGGSNRRICYEVLRYDYSKTDIAIILWTYKERTCQVNKDEIIDIGHWSKTDYANGFLMLDDIDLDISENMYQTLAYYHLLSKNIPQIHILYSKHRHKHFEWNPVQFEDYDFNHRGEYPKALDNAHPGQKAHVLLSEWVINSIDNRNLF